MGINILVGVRDNSVMFKTNAGGSRDSFTLG
jgi:hypothetical protein